jgi:hypothetical protein
MWLVWPEQADGGPELVGSDAVSGRKQAGTNSDCLDPGPSRRVVDGHADNGACRARLEEAESELRATRAALAELLKDEQQQEHLPYFVTDQEELLGMAKRCELRTDRPEKLAPNDARELGLSSEELNVYNSTLAMLLDEYANDFEAAFAEDLGMSPEELNTFKSLPMQEQLQYLEQNDTRAEDGRDLRRILAEERAGLRESPADLSELPGHERKFRLREGIGDSFEDRLAKTLGRARARELRMANGGWLGARSMSTGCRDSVVEGDGGT